MENRGIVPGDFSMALFGAIGTPRISILWSHGGVRIRAGESMVVVSITLACKEVHKFIDSPNRRAKSIHRDFLA